MHFTLSCYRLTISMSQTKSMQISGLFSVTNSINAFIESWISCGNYEKSIDLFCSYWYFVDMKKESLALYLFKLFLIFGLFVWTGMLYWSSLIVEENIQSLRTEVSEIKQKMQGQSTQMVSHVQTTQKAEEAVTGSYAHMDPNLPNLLEKDPFYETTLPKLLGPNFVPHGTMHESTLGKPENLHPFSEWGEVQNWVGKCNVTVATLAFGKYDSFAPAMAVKIERRGNAFWVFLRDDAYWQPITPDLFTEKIDLAPVFSQKHQVTAYDYKFQYDAVMNPYNQEGGRLLSAIP